MTAKKHKVTEDYIKECFERNKPEVVYWRAVAEYISRMGWKGKIATVNRTLASMTSYSESTPQTAKLILRHPAHDGWYCYNPKFIPISKINLDHVFAEKKVKVVHLEDDEEVVIVRKKQNETRSG